MFAVESIISAKETIYRLEEVLEVKPLYKIKNPLKPIHFDIEFENISFTYEASEKPVIQDVSLRIPEKKYLQLLEDMVEVRSLLQILFQDYGILTMEILE
ncbi:hypothetical protein HMJ28_13015 [Clostridium cochlearium]|uniref:Uncharacterized protein n=2 Tax=Clostridium cochlearium TaxID=1494 RepID=A0A7Y4DF02_CLOCO|nr:hypothetical protein [Clostridium cochlearium]